MVFASVLHHRTLSVAPLVSAAALTASAVQPSIGAAQKRRRGSKMAERAGRLEGKLERLDGREIETWMGNQQESEMVRGTGGQMGRS